MLQISYVKGIDLSPGEIAEAQKRFDDFSSKPGKRGGVWAPCLSQMSQGQHPRANGNTYQGLDMSWVFCQL